MLQASQRLDARKMEENRSEILGNSPALAQTQEGAAKLLRKWGGAGNNGQFDENGR